jgi:DNA-binding LacI/PurR family transcriptional regulator
MAVQGRPVKRVRIRDVAAEAGVSPTTTSFVLNGRDAAIPEATRQRVLDTARRLGYRPNASARALATGRTHRVGVALNHPYSLVGRGIYHTEILAGIMSALPHLNYNLLLHSADYRDWHALRDDILGGVADGVLLVGREAPDPLTIALLDAGFPTVCVSYNVDHPDCHAVDCDNEQGAYEAISHLLSLGHRQILTSISGAKNSWQRERERGALRAVRERGLPEPVLQPWTWPLSDRPVVERVQEMARFLKEASPRPTALFTEDEHAAQVLAEQLPGFGFRVPEDFSIISFNSTEVSARTRPPLTSVWQPLGDIGAEAARMLARRIAGEEVPEKVVRFAIRLDVRASTGPCAPATLSDAR